jgi:hypothetical protein
MTLPWETKLDPYPSRCENINCPSCLHPAECAKYDGIPACLKRDANNRAPWMNKINPAKGLQASPPNWVPPWVTNSPLPDA